MIFLLLVVAALLAFVGVHAVIYGALIGLYVLCWRMIPSKVLRVVVPTAVVVAIALPLYWTSLLDWRQFSERRERFGGDHYVQTVERPEGIAFRRDGRNEAFCDRFCQELLLEDQVEYVEAGNEIWLHRAGYQKPRRYTKRQGESECALVKKIMGDPESNPVAENRHEFLRSNGYVPIQDRKILAADQCIVSEEIDAFTAPVVVYFWPVERPPTPSYRNWSTTTHVDVYWRERDNDADGLIGWQESASVKVLGFPPRLHRRGAMNLSFWTAIGYSAAERDSFISKALSVSLDGRYDLTAESIPSLISTLRDGPKPLVLAAATALNQLGPMARSAEPALRDQLRNPDGEVRSAAAYALKKIGAEEQATLDALILALTDESGKALGSVANALGSFGPRAAPALPHLIPLIASRDSWQPLRWSVAQIGSAAVPPLTAALRSDDPWVRESAADILGKIGSDASPALLVLRDLTKENPKRGVYARVISDIEKANKAPASAPLPGNTGADTGSRIPN